MQDEKLPATLCRRRRAIMETSCRLCSGDIHRFKFFYKLPIHIVMYRFIKTWYWYNTIRYEDYFSDHHCERCHKERKERFGHCPKCQAFAKEKKPRKVSLKICPR
jgi:hypothetical protein